MLSFVCHKCTMSFKGICLLISLWCFWYRKCLIFFLPRLPVVIVLDCNSIPSLLNFKKLRTLSSRFLLPKCTLFIHTSPCYKRFKASACVHSFINSLKRSFTGTWLILPRHFPFINNYVRGDIINSALRQSIYILKMLFPKTKTNSQLLKRIRTE